MSMLSAMAETTPPGADRLIFLPWLSGERAPCWIIMHVEPSSA